MTYSICYLNQKGGVGKTTIAHNTAYMLATLHNKRVLLVDLDQQGNSSELYMVDKNSEPSVANVFKEKSVNIESIIRKAQVKSNVISNMDILHSNISLSQALKEIPIRMYKEKILEKALKPIVAKYDYIILDCPASIEDSVINAIYFATRFVIPVEMGGFASSAIQDVLELIAEVKNYSSLQDLLDTKIVRFLKNKVDGRGSFLNKKIDQEIQEILPYTFNKTIRQSLYISRATVAKLPIIEYKNTPLVVKNDYKDYINELIQLTRS
jgi:chromosome partitioning protein